MSPKMICKNSPKTNYTGKEMSPLGLGFCADAEKVGVKMTGRDEKDWIVGLTKGMKVWIRAPKETKAPAPVPEPVEEGDSVEEESDTEKDIEEEAPATPPPVKKTKAKPKPKAKDESVDETDSTDEEKSPPSKKTKPKKTPLDKILETHNIHGAAAADIKELFAKKVKKSKSDEDKPKRVPSTYNKFVKARLGDLRKEQPNLEAKEYMKLAGAEWKLLSDEEKSAYA